MKRKGYGIMRLGCLAMALCRKLWGRCQTERFVRMVEEQEAR